MTSGEQVSAMCLLEAVLKFSQAPAYLSAAAIHLSFHSVHNQLVLALVERDALGQLDLDGLQRGQQPWRAA